MKKSKIFKIILMLICVVAVVVFAGYKLMLYYGISNMVEGQVEEQVSLQYDNEKQTKARQKLNIEQFKDNISAMGEERYVEICALMNGATIEGVQEMYVEEKITCEELVTFYMKRISLYDEGKLNSIIELNPDAIDLARKFDKDGNAGKLRGIPILLKANIATGDKMHTSAGAAAIGSCLMKDDAVVVKKLREQGALILGKTNLSEWANYMSYSSSSGYSALGGQTHNAYGKYDVGGSSSGSAVSISADFAMVSLGTETAGSIIYPSNQNSVIGIKPSLGLASRTGIIPITTAMDTAGVIAKNVKDAALVLDVISGYDKVDADSAKVGSVIGQYMEYSQKNSLEGTKIALVKTYVSNDESKILKRIAKELSDVGATVKVVELDEDKVNTLDIGTVLSHGFLIDVNKFLRDAAVEGIGSLADIVEYNKQDSENRAPYGQEYLEGALDSQISDKKWSELVKNNRMIARGEIDGVLKEADVILSIRNDLSAVYAVAGYPAISVPAGYKGNGEPVGATFVASIFEEGKLLWIAGIYEEATKHRKSPELS